MYTASLFTLTSMADAVTTAAAAINPFAANFVAVYGERIRLIFTVEKTAANYAAGTRFIFNPCLFSAGGGTVQPFIGVGWVIDIMTIGGAGTFDIYLRTDGSNLTNSTQRNGYLSCALTSAKKLQITFDFYACEDYKTYMQPAPRNNFKRLLSASQDVETLSNISDSIWERVQSYADLFFYEANIDFNPVSSTAYARLAATPQSKIMSMPMQGKFYNDGIGAQAYWDIASARPSELCLWTWQTTVDGCKISEMKRRIAPVMSKDLRTNYDANDEELYLMKDKENAVTIVISRPTGWVTTGMVARLIRTDAATGAQFFPNEYEIKEYALPASDLTPYNPASLASITTPIAWSDSGANNISVAFRINGNRLRTDADYSLVLISYNAAGGKGSTTTLPARVISNVRGDSLTLALTGGISTFDNIYTGNDVKLAMFQRFSAEMTINGNTYGAGNFTFLDRLQTATARYMSGTTMVAQAVYDFVNASTTTNPAMAYAATGANNKFSAIFRVPYTGTPAPPATEVLWEFVLREPTAGGGFASVTVLTTQQIRRYEMDTVEILALVYLDYKEFQIANKVPIDTLCNDTELYVIEIEIANNPPQKSVTALLFYDDGNGGTTIREHNGFVPTYLPRLQDSGLLDVDANFSGNFAYFVLDISQLPNGFEGAAIGCILQE